MAQIPPQTVRIEAPAVTLRVLFARPGDHVPSMSPAFTLPAVPRPGDGVSLLRNETDSFAEHFVVSRLHWTPDHTGWDVTVVLDYPKGQS
jgi:hypothetical protein